MRRIRIAAVDLAAAVGLGLLTIGAGLVYLPLAFVVPGAALLLWAIAASRSEAPEA